MCNLYRMTKGTDEVAKWFDAANATRGANFGDEVYPGYPGAVVVEGELQRMTWGFPLTQKSKRTGEPLKPRPVNNARADNLDSFMWRYSFQERRCLIPLTAWAEAEGTKGGKTRTWLSLPDQPVFACAGIWRTSEEWGDVYSMVMTDSCGVAAECHDRMPVILDREHYVDWVNGTAETARSLCVPYQGELRIDRTAEPWGGARPPRSPVG